MASVQCKSCDWSKDAAAPQIPPRCPKCGSAVESGSEPYEPVETKSDKV